VLIFALGIVSIPLWPGSRANSLQWSQREFVPRRAQGATNRRVMIREVLPQRVARDVLHRCWRSPW
jgi:ABC-type dipeptide/oligopeptide/nickel transport system permease subunit